MAEKLEVSIFSEHNNTGDEILEAFRRFIKSKTELIEKIRSEQSLIDAISKLKVNQGYDYAEYAISKLCADCFMFGVFVAYNYMINSSNYDKVFNILKNQMKLSSVEAKESARYATGIAPDAELDDLLLLALKYHGGN